MSFESVPTVEEQKEEIKAMNNRMKKLYRQKQIKMVACGFILGALSATILYVLSGGYL